MWDRTVAREFKTPKKKPDSIASTDQLLFHAQEVIKRSREERARFKEILADLRRRFLRQPWMKRGK
jgi:hypothetical protein